jgi:hypothetical protein
MKFSTSSSELLKQLQIANGAIGSNPVLPILENFLFRVENKRLTIASTDLETSITTSIEVMIRSRLSRSNLSLSMLTAKTGVSKSLPPTVVTNWPVKAVMNFRMCQNPILSIL